MENKNRTIAIEVLFKFLFLGFIAAVVLELLKPGFVTRNVSGDWIFILLIAAFSVFSWLSPKQGKSD